MVKKHPLKLALHWSDLPKHTKMPTPKQMLQRLPMVIAQVKAGHTSEKLLNEV